MTKYTFHPEITAGSPFWHHLQGLEVLLKRETVSTL